MPRRAPTPEQFQVEVILAARLSDTNSSDWEYKIKWYGYDKASDITWEPSSGIEPTCERLLNSFWEHVGPEKRQYSGIRYQVVAEKDWIEDEKRYFRENSGPQPVTEVALPTSSRTPNASGTAKGKVVNKSRSKKSSQEKTKKVVRPTNISPEPIAEGLKIRVSRKPTESSALLEPVPTIPNAPTDRPQEPSPPLPTHSLFSEPERPPIPPPTKLSSWRKEPRIKFVDYDLEAMEPRSIRSELPPAAGPSSKPASDLPRISKALPEGLSFRKNNPVPESGAAADGPDSPEIMEIDEPVTARQSNEYSDDLYEGFHDSPIDDVVPVDSEPPTAEDLGDFSDTLDDGTRNDVQEIDMSELLLEPQADELVASPDSAKLHTGLRSPSATSDSARWTAKLYISSDPEAKDVSFYDLHDLPPLENFMAQGLELTFRKFINLEDLIFVLPECIRSLRLLEVRPESGMEDMRTLSTYMLKMGLVTPTTLADEMAGPTTLLLFPAAMDIYGILGVSSFRKVDGIMAAVIPRGRGPIGRNFRLENVAALPTLRTRPPVIPIIPDRRQFVSKSFVVWPWPSDDQSSSIFELESQQLCDILQSIKAQDVGLEGKYRVIFIHIVLFKCLDKLCGLSTIRQQPQIQFFSYGTDPVVPHQQWGIKPVFPLGGIITFTAEALVQDPVGSATLINKIYRHPLWHCYILPSVMGTATSFLCGEADLVAEIQLGNFLLTDVAIAMHERKVALTWAPTLKGRSTLQEWINSQLKMLPSVPTGQSVEESLIGILEFCLDDFRAQYSNVAIPNLSHALAKELSRDFRTFQQQQWIAENHRRFVVVSSGPESSNPNPKLICNSFELTTIEDFRFQDNFDTSEENTAPKAG